MRCSSVTVTFHPCADILRRQIAAIPSDWWKVVVDNGTPIDEWVEIEAAINDFERVDVVRLKENKGLAAAQNVGLRRLAGLGVASHVLILDQDSEPDFGAVLRLSDSFMQLQASGSNPGAVGPALIDPDGGGEHGFHVISGLRWRRVWPRVNVPVRCAGLNGSGTFMSLSVALANSGMDESLFIDMVDADWSFRLKAAGYELFGVPDAVFSHRMGERTTRIWIFGWHTWPVRAPRRNRYLFRNSVKLMGRGYVPWVWKAWSVPKLVVTALVFGLLGPMRKRQLVEMVRGLVDGVRGRGGRIV